MRHSLCTNQPRVNCSWTGFNSLTQHTWAHYRGRQPNAQYTKKGPYNSKNIKLKNIGFELKRKSTTIKPSILIAQIHSQQFVIRSSTCYLSGELVLIEIKAPRPQSQPLYPNPYSMIIQSIVTSDKRQPYNT